MTRKTNNPHAVTSRPHRRIAIGTVAATIVLATIIVMWSFAPSTDSPPTAQSSSGVTEVPEETNALPPIAPSAMDPEDDAEDVDFWHDMLESTECNLVTGSGTASDAAIMLAPNASEPAGDETVFRVVDDTGTLFEGELPFRPNVVWLRRHLDGRVLAGFSYLLLNSKASRDPSSPEPVVVYQDSEKIYETDKAWSFGIAGNGSAFYTIEPEADDTSNLIIRDIDGAVVRSHDLEYTFTSDSAEVPFLAGFTGYDDEIMFRPNSAYRDHMFYPVGEGKSRAVRYRGKGNLLGGVLASSKTGFYVYNQGEDKPAFIVREQFNWDSPTERVSEVWSTEIDLDHFYGDMYLSDDNRYLLLMAMNTHLLDAETGRVLFAHPAAENLGRGLRDAPPVGRVTAAGVAYRKADRERLASVMDVDGDQDIGAIMSYGFRDGELYVYRTIGMEAGRRCLGEHLTDFDGRQACMERLRASGEYFDVLDLFDLASIQIDSQPDRRVVVEHSEYACRPGSKSGLAFDDGNLRYVGQED